MKTYLSEVELFRVTGGLYQHLMFLQEFINRHVARAVFASGCPLSFTENQYWLKAFAVLRPSYKPPTRYRLTNVYLKEEYGQLQIKCREYLESANSVAVLCDGWTNVRFAHNFCLIIFCLFVVPFFVNILPLYACCKVQQPCQFTTISFDNNNRMWIAATQCFCAFLC